MKKFIILLFFILTFSTLNLIGFSHNQNIPTLADSGFDADYDYDYDSGSSWDDDYGSSWDDDYYDSGSGYGGYNGNSSGGSVSADPEVLLLTFAIISLPFILLLLVKIISRKRKNLLRKKEFMLNILKDRFYLIPGDGCYDPLIQIAYQNYVKIQEAWMNRDLSTIRHLLTDEMYNMYQMQVESLIEDNQINVMSNFEFVCGRIKTKTKQNNTETLNIMLCLKCKDYIKVANKNKVISGSKHTKVIYVYELTFIRDINTGKTTYCPACGALIKNQMSVTCKYCNSTLQLTSSEITLSNKTVKHQFKDE